MKGLWIRGLWITTKGLWIRQKDQMFCYELLLCLILTP